MSPKEIRFELYKLRPDVTQASIARELGVTPPAVQNTITRSLVSKRIAAKIAEHLHKPVEYVFPDVYLKKPDNS